MRDRLIVEERVIAAFGHAGGVFSFESSGSTAVLAEDSDSPGAHHEMGPGEVYVLRRVEVPGRSEHEEERIVVALELRTLPRRQELLEKRMKVPGGRQLGDVFRH